MGEIRIHVPAMYGDHHVVEVRRLLLQLPGVKEVYASSCFQTIQVRYEDSALKEQAIIKTLEDAGYLNPLEVPVEPGVPAYGNTRSDPFFRHTAAYEQTRQVVSFKQIVTNTARPLWPCPGMGVIRNDEVKKNG